MRALKLLTAALAAGVVALLTLWAFEVLPGAGTEYVDCTIARSAADYPAEGRGRARVLFAQTLLTAECLATDAELDGADGARRGRVRWSHCEGC